MTRIRTSPDWQTPYADQIGTARSAVQLIRPGDQVFIGTGCAAPQHLLRALVEHGDHIHDARIVHLLTMGAAPYLAPRCRDRFRMNTFFVAENVREAVAGGIGDYTPIFLSEIPRQFEEGRVPIDVALISVCPPDERGLCSLGISVDVVKSAAANARYVIAQVNPRMPRTLGDSFIHVNEIDVLVPLEEPLIEMPRPETDARVRRIAEHVARLVENGSTIEFGIGSVPQAVAEFLTDKKDLGIHTEMFGDWIIDLVESGAVTGSRKTVNRDRIVASFCMGTRRLYEYIHDNPKFEFHPTSHVNDPAVIASLDRMVAVNVGIEVDLTGQVCADSIGHRFYSGFGGQVDFIRGAARSREGKPIIALPSTARHGTVSRIVAHLTEGAGVVTTRADVHYVVTEFGVAYLHGKSIRERALALINIAHPDFRQQLIEAAKARHYIEEDQIELAWERIRYPAQLERYETLRDGTQMLFRPVKPTDEAALTESLYALSTDSVRKRFFTSTKTFPHRDVQQLTSIDYENNLAIVAVMPGPAGDEIAGVGQYFLDPKTGVAEVAFLVQDERQRKGIGTILLRRLAEIAAQRGVRRFEATVLPENKAMLAVFEHGGLARRSDFDGSVHTVSFELPAAPR